VYENSIHLAADARVEKEISGNPDQSAERTFRKATEILERIGGKIYVHKL